MTAGARRGAPLAEPAASEVAAASPEPAPSSSSAAATSPRPQREDPGGAADRGGPAAHRDASRELLLGHPAYDAAASNQATEHVAGAAGQRRCAIYNDSWRYPRRVHRPRGCVMWELDPSNPGLEAADFALRSTPPPADVAPVRPLPPGRHPTGEPPDDLDPPRAGHRQQRAHDGDDEPSAAADPPARRSPSRPSQGHWQRRSRPAIGSRHAPRRARRNAVHCDIRMSRHSTVQPQVIVPAIRTLRDLQVSDERSSLEGRLLLVAKLAPRSVPRGTSRRVDAGVRRGIVVPGRSGLLVEVQPRGLVGGPSSSPGSRSVNVPGKDERGDRSISESSGTV